MSGVRQNWAGPTQCLEHGAKPDSVLGPQCKTAPDMRIFHFFREYGEARSATAARRTYGYISLACLLVIVSWVFIAAAPLWVFWAVVVADAAADLVLVRRWMFKDAVVRGRPADQIPQGGP